MKTHPLELLISDYLTEKDIAKGTFDLYLSVLKQYVNYLKAHEIIYASSSDITNYRNEKKNQGYTTGWINNHITALKGLYKYLSDNQKRLGLPLDYENDITKTIKNEPRNRPKIKQLLTIEEAKQLILSTKANRKYIWTYRDHAMIYLMITTGLRSVEVRRARIKDLKTINQESVLYVQGKGRQSADEYVKLPSGVSLAVRDYLNKRTDDNPYLFISHSKRTTVLYLSRAFFDGMLKRILDDAGLPHIAITPHALRHTAATLNLMRGESLEKTKQFMRHTNMDSTLIYAHHIKQMTDDSVDQVEAYILEGQIETD